MIEKVEARPLDKGMGVAVARRTVFRREDQEDMGRVADRVAAGNVALTDVLPENEELELRNAIASATYISSGRHLQHGDALQPTRNMELHTNCSTAALSFGKFYLLLNGSGVGRSYDDIFIKVNWDKGPKLKIALHPDHVDYPKTREQLFKFGIDFKLLAWTQDEDGSWLPPSYDSFDDVQLHRVVAFRDELFDGEARVAPIKRDARENGTVSLRETDGFVDTGSETDLHFVVPDSREGWAQGSELYESLAYAERDDVTLTLEYTMVRYEGAPIGGMQDRPASGPLSVLRAFDNIRRNVVGKGMPLWKQAMHVDHYFSEEVQVGGARRAARMSSKSYLDEDIFEFITIKRDNGLWTSNNSIMVDQGFWQAVARSYSPVGVRNDYDQRCRDIFDLATESMWFNGEPGFINGDKLESVRTGLARQKPVYDDGRDFGSQKYQVTWAQDLLRDVAQAARDAVFPMTVNPCGEIELHPTGAYCVIGDVCPLFACPDADVIDRVPGSFYPSEHAEWQREFNRAAEIAARMLIRVNLMDSLYSHEVKRTNRIGVSLTGIHEYAWMRFGYTFLDVLDEERTADFWASLNEASEAAKAAAEAYAAEVGLPCPHTVVTIKPAGTTSKLYGLSEGAHLPAMRQYVRWVQKKGQKGIDGKWRADADPLLKKYEDLGYPVRELKTFPGMSIVGFPTAPLICRMMPEDQIVTAPEATPEQQYKWLQLLEKHWIGAERGNQISYTLKVYTTDHTLEDFRRMVLKYQPTIRACAVLPSVPDKEMGYEYLPEEEVPLEKFMSLVDGIRDESVKEDIDMVHLQCASGACPI